MVRNELARIVRLFDSYTERRARHVVPVSSKVDANAFRQVHAIVTRMHDGGPALLTALRHGSPLSARSRPASTPPRYASQASVDEAALGTIPADAPFYR